MGIVRVLPEVEEWLDAEAESWTALSDKDYAALVRRWRDGFLPLITGRMYSFQGNRALQAIAELLPANAWLFSGIMVHQLQNTGGLGAAGYQVCGLRRMRRYLANGLELIATGSDFSWSCVFSHEAGALVSECLYERPPDPEPFGVLDPAWQTTNVLSLARTIYNDRAFDLLPILADALEEAGCDNADILNHCRQTGEHARGCWVIDRLLAKE